MRLLSKTLIFAGLFTLSALSYAADIQIESHPGLQKGGQFSVVCNYHYARGGNSYYNSSGLVSLPPGYPSYAGLSGALASVRDIVNDGQIDAIDLNLTLMCANYAFQSYHFSMQELRGPDPIIIPAPKGC